MRWYLTYIEKRCKLIVGLLGWHRLWHTWSSIAVLTREDIELEKVLSGLPEYSFRAQWLTRVVVLYAVRGRIK